MSAVGTKLLLIFPNNFIEEYEHSDFIWEVTYSSMSLGKWEVKRMKQEFNAGVLSSKYFQTERPITGDSWDTGLRAPSCPPKKNQK